MINNKMKVVFAPGVLETMESVIPADKIQEVLDEIKAYAESEQFMQSDDDQIFDLDELQDTDPELYEDLIQQLEAFDQISPITLQ